MASTGMLSNIRLLIESGRPKQWTKNLVVFAAIIFSGKLVSAQLLGKTILGFVSLCLFSSSIYILNDLLDIEKDRRHPKKRLRPLASGRLSQRFAAGGLVFFMIAATAIGYLFGISFLFAAYAYVFLQLAYSFFLKNFVLIDIIVIAAGFVLRAVAGALIIGAAISPWLLVCAALLALFLAAAKRRHEVLLLGGDGNSHRPVLQHYSAELLDELLSTLSAATITTYSLYTFFAAHPGAGERMMLTIPFVLYGVLRYQYLVHVKDAGGSPEEVLLKDRPTLVNILLWMLSVVVVLYWPR
jgi:4-hydroxybenzoate polyprenyltransferase